MIVYCNSNAKASFILFLLVFPLLLLFTNYNICNVSGQAVSGGHIPDDGATTTEGGNVPGTTAGGNVRETATTSGGNVPETTSGGNVREGSGSNSVASPPGGPCISIYLPSQLGSGIDNCLRLNERTTVLNFMNPTVMLKSFSGGWCSIGDYIVKDIRGQTYCLESDK